MSTKIGSTSRQRKRGGAPTKGRPKLKFPFPPPNFDPLGASPAELVKYGLPLRPDSKQPELLKAWLRLFEGLPKFSQPTRLARDMFLEERQVRKILPNRTRFGNSPNWCGASIVPNGGNQLVLVFGEWTVPKPELPPPLEQGPARQENKYHCVTWIGVDGNRRYLNSSLPQIGTEQILTVAANGTQSYEYFAWFQWWARRQAHMNRKVISNITIDAGVSVMAAVWVIDPHHVVAILRTYAPSNQITVLVEQTPELDLKAAKKPKFRPAISGASVEWIHERPLKEGEPTLFAKYNPVPFRHCVAGAAPKAGVPPTLEQKLAGARLFRLFVVPETLRPCMRFTSMPRRTSETSIEVQYGGFPD
jgi:hypothetical protein